MKVYVGFLLSIVVWNFREVFVRNPCAVSMPSMHQLESSSILCPFMFMSLTHLSAAELPLKACTPFNNSNEGNPTQQITERWRNPPLNQLKNETTIQKFT